MPSATLSSSLKHKTVAPFWVEYLLDAALRAGVDLSYALVASGISNEDLEDPQSRISMAIENQLLRQAIADSADPLFGLHMGKGFARVSWGTGLCQHVQRHAGRCH